jgi:hypothetical protein
MTEEERVKKWSRGISEMDELSMDERKTVCHQAAVQMVILCGAIEIVVVGFLIWAALQYPEIIPGFNRITDLLNSNFEHSGTRAKRIGAIIVSLPALLLLIATVLIPMIGIFVGCRKHLVRRAAGKMSHQWRMETDLKMTRGITFADVKQGMELLQDDKIQFLIISPPFEVMDSLFMQTAHEEGNRFTLEVSRKENNSSVVYAQDGQTKEQVLYAMQNYMDRKRVPDTGNWEKIASFERVPKELLKNVYWMFNEIIYVSTNTFSHDVVEYIEDNHKNWHPGGMAVKAEKIYVIYEAFIPGKEALLANEYVTDASTLDEECKIDGLFQTDIAALLYADNGKYFTNEELLMKIHNQMTGKDLGTHAWFEGLERNDPLEGTSCYHVLLGS